MSLVGLLVACLIFGLIWYLITLLPVDARIKQVAFIILIVIAIIYLLSALGLVSGIRIT